MIHTSQGVHSSVPGLVKAGGQLGIPGRPNHRALVVSGVSGEASRQVQWQAMHQLKCCCPIKSAMGQSAGQ